MYTHTSVCICWYVHIHIRLEFGTEIYFAQKVIKHYALWSMYLVCHIQCQVQTLYHPI